MMVKQGSVDPLRKSFVTLFATAMRTRVHPMQAKAFLGIFLAYPFAFLFVLTAHILGGKFPQNYLLNFFWVEFCFSSILFLFFLYKDWETTRYCARKIFYHNPSWEKKLHASANTEWVGDDTKPPVKESELPALWLVKK